MSSDETTADITHRLRRWTISTDAVPASDLMDEAAAEIDRLRSQPCPYVTGTVTRYCTLPPCHVPSQKNLTLTDAEREAVEWFAAGDETCYGWGWKRRAATLRGLLERTAGDRPEAINVGESDRPQPINAARLAALEELSALDQALELEYGLTGNPMIKAQERTAATHSTPGECRVQGDGIPKQV